MSDTPFDPSDPTQSNYQEWLDWVAKREAEKQEINEAWANLRDTLLDSFSFILKPTYALMVRVDRWFVERYRPENSRDDNE